VACNDCKSQEIATFSHLLPEPRKVWHLNNFSCIDPQKRNQKKLVLAILDSQRDLAQAFESG
jgi:hypothetical protein